MAHFLMKFIDSQMQSDDVISKFHTFTVQQLQTRLKQQNN